MVVVLSHDCEIYVEKDERVVPDRLAVFRWKQKYGMSYSYDVLVFADETSAHESQLIKYRHVLYFRGVSQKVRQQVFIL